MQFTVVLGVDDAHVEHLKLVLPTWAKHKPSLLEQQFVLFYDRDMKLGRVSSFLEQYAKNVRYQIWPPEEIKYEGFETYFRGGNVKWFKPQRNKMLSGFVHVPAMTVQTLYWLKLDLDVVATGKNDWVDEEWFSNNKPAIVSHPWGYTKPPGQMCELDLWFREKVIPKFPTLGMTKPLNLLPEPGSSLVKHKRIISWCAFFNTEFTRLCSDLCSETVGVYKLPVPSQDGVMWYLAKRLNYDIVTTNMKSRGWDHQSRITGIKKAVKGVM